MSDWSRGKLLESDLRKGGSFSIGDETDLEITMINNRKST